MSNNRFDKANIEKAFKDKRNANKWSTCSIKAITEFVSKASCLFNTPLTDPYPLFSWQELKQSSMAQWLNAQVPHRARQCSMYLPFKHLGPDDGYIYETCGTDPCQYMECKRSGHGEQGECAVHERQSAMEGTECGNIYLTTVGENNQQKHCYQGNCIAGKYTVGSYNTHIRASCINCDITC